MLKVLKIEKKSAIYVGDSEVDVETAKNAQINHIIVEWGFRDRDYLMERGAEVLVSTVEDLRKNIYEND